MTKKQTSVDWLEEKINTYDFSQGMAQMRKFILQAKDMETKQLSKSYHKGVRHEWEGAGGNFQDYYEETYGNETSI
jgi:hypothetical protein